MHVCTTHHCHLAVVNRGEDSLVQRSLPPEVVDERELEEGGEDEHGAGPHPDVDGLDVGHGREVSLDARPFGRYGEQRGDAQRDSSRYRLHVQPKGHPRNDHDEHGG